MLNVKSSLLLNIAYIHPLRFDWNRSVLSVENPDSILVIELNPMKISLGKTKMKLSQFW